jgi:NAD-dependent deacetylase
MKTSKIHKKPPLKLVVISGAGMSAESGIATFRGLGGIWEGKRIEDVATPEAFERDPCLVLEFYNERRRNVIAAKPNPGHIVIKSFEELFEVVILTQNVDDLHERAGSTHILHIHGELMKARSSSNPDYTITISGPELNLGDMCPYGSQLRPDIVWFGEAVPMMESAIDVVSHADIVIIVGTSLQVYPAASLIQHISAGVSIFLIDPNPPALQLDNLEVLKMGAVEGLAHLLQRFTSAS